MAAELTPDITSATAVNPDQPLLLALVGLAGAGKSTAVEYCQTVLQAEIVYFGGLVVERARDLGMPPGEASERAVREEWRAQHGMAALAVAAAPRVDSHLAAGQPVIIDGLYSWAEHEWLRSRFRVVTVAVHADRRLREERLAQRPTRPLTAAELWSRDLAEVAHLDKATPIALADYHVINNQSPEELRRQLDQVVEDIKLGGNGKRQ